MSNALGCGFLEKVYENALAHELRSRECLAVEQQKALNVYYDGVLVGEYVADLLVAERVLVELKTVDALDDIHRAQCLNYLHAAGLRVCLLMNLSRLKVEIKRIAL